MEKESCFTGCLKENKKGRHAELDSASHLISVLKSGEIPNQVWNDGTNNNGFTLIELLVVVLIIGILAAVALPKYEMAVMRSRYATLKANVNALLDAEKIYYLSNGEYTDDMEALSIDLTGCTLSGNKSVCTYPWGNCQVRPTNDPPRIHCENTGTLKNAYVRYWDFTGYGSSSCWALSNNRTDKYNKLCQKEGGTFIGAGSCSGGDGGCQIYKLTN